MCDGLEKERGRDTKLFRRIELEGTSSACLVFEGAQAVYCRDDMWLWMNWHQPLCPELDSVLQLRRALDRTVHRFASLFTSKSDR